MPNFKVHANLELLVEVEDVDDYNTAEKIATKLVDQMLVAHIARSYAKTTEFKPAGVRETEDA